MSGSAAENDANAANYDEIAGHVQILNAKLMSMSQNTAMSTALEDYSDYYERAVQLRQMRIQTLETLLEEKDASDAQFREKAVRFGVSVFFTCFATLFFVQPELFLWVVSNFSSYAVVAAVTVALVRRVG
jgi:hypothetical protein